MSHHFGKRVERLEDQLIIGEERQEFERHLRFHYNLMRVSDKALHASLEALQQRHPTPDWAEAEFQRPIPAEAYPHSVREAERKAREDMRLS